MILHVFNPENDLALADGGANYSPTPAACRIAYDLACLPLWFADAGDAVLLPDGQHCEYAEVMSPLFVLAKPYEKSFRNNVTMCRPWGWSPQMLRKLQTAGFGELLPAKRCIDAIRELSNRRTSIKILEALAERGFDTPAMPLYMTAADDVAEFINSRQRCVVKAPWSGSGKGVMWGLGRVETPLENFYKGVIRRQGGVVCENFLDSIVEFAMEFRSSKNGIAFSGYSLFNTHKGSYTGNMLASDRVIEERIAEYIPLHELHRLRSELEKILQDISVHECYDGYLGVDMMIYDDKGNMRLNPCMELNLRMNMGMVSRLFYDKHVSAASVGDYKVDFFKRDGEALALHEKNMQEYPLTVKEGKIVSGYINLSPITARSRYSAYAIIKNDS